MRHHHRRDRGAPRRRPGRGRRRCPPPPPDNPLAEELYKKYGNEFREQYLTEGQAGPVRGARRVQGPRSRRRTCRKARPSRSTPPAQVSGGARAPARADLPRDHPERHPHRRPRRRRTCGTSPCEVARAARGRTASAVFQRGETQALVVATLGTVAGRAEGGRAAGRVLEEVHARLQLPAVLGRRVQADPRAGPPRDRPRDAGRAVAEGGHPAGRRKFPYTIRLVSEILESNGSSQHGVACAAARWR